MVIVNLLLYGSAVEFTLAALRNSEANLFVGRKKAESLVRECLETHHQTLSTTLHELSFNNFEYLDEFSEMAVFVVRESAAKLGVAEAEMLLGIGPKQRALVRLMKDLEFTTRHALESRERQQHLSIPWLTFHTTAAIAGLLWVTITARAYIRDFNIDRQHQLFNSYESGTEVLRTLFDYGSKKIGRDKAIENLPHR